LRLLAHRPGAPATGKAEIPHKIGRHPRKTGTIVRAMSRSHIGPASHVCTFYVDRRLHTRTTQA
jgi:hypothetical protein